MYNMKKYNNTYLNISRSLWQYYRDESFFDANDAIADFPADNSNTASFEIKTKIEGRAEIDSTKDVKLTVPLKYLSSFGRTCERLLINCEIELILT